MFTDGGKHPFSIIVSVLCGEDPDLRSSDGGLFFISCGEDLAAGSSDRATDSTASASSHSALKWIHRVVKSQLGLAAAVRLWRTDFLFISFDFGPSVVNFTL